MQCFYETRGKKFLQKVEETEVEKKRLIRPAKRTER